MEQASDQVKIMRYVYIYYDRPLKLPNGKELKVRISSIELFAKLN